jgi:hypothetical protein
MVDGAVAAARHLLESDLLPIFDAKTLRALHRRGGLDRALAEMLYTATRGAA